MNHGQQTPPRWWLLTGMGVLFVLALSIRLLYLWQASDSPFFSVRGLDGRLYHQAAERFVRGGWPGDEPFFRAPLYLGILYRVLGDDVGPVRVVQTFLGAASCALTFLLAGLLFRRRFVALAAGAICCVYGPLIYFDGQLLPASLDLFLQLGALSALVLAYRKGSHWLLWLLPRDLPGTEHDQPGRVHLPRCGGGGLDDQPARG